ncbi:MAG: division/cell wall cluster transcriptional repressor MraZ [Treponema sp.]|jgi:MraZ protein|nr:division/cell wall cluster transcriptional repressor MraZ [Treponema sp.]
MVYLSTLDDKGRISLPTRLRGTLTENKLILTKGNSLGIWVFLPEAWEQFSQDVAASAASFEESTLIQHQFIIPMVEQEIDKAGRIAIPPSLRDFAGLSRDCKILEARKHLEIWDSECYEGYLKANTEKLQGIMAKMGPLGIFS